jgi:hypothetical protein
LNRSRLLIALAFLAGGTLGVSAGQASNGPSPQHRGGAHATRPVGRFHVPPAAIRRRFTAHLASRGPVHHPLGFTVARVIGARSVALRRAPGAPAFASAGPRTEFGSPTRLAVAKRRGRWLGVETPAVPNGQLAWVDGRSPAVALGRTRVSLRVDLSKRRLTLLAGTHAVRRVNVGIGLPSTPTPVGRFAVTDELSGPSFSSSYGCCILAISGHQPDTPAGWRGGDRLAIHGTPVPSTVGQPASAGCLRARDGDLRFLMRRVPLGTPVFIRR